MTFDDFTPRERNLSGALAIAMHLLFFILLVVGVSWQPKRTAQPVMVELWSELPPAPKAKPAPPEPEPVTQAPRPQPRPEPRPELKPLPKPDIALKEQLFKKKELEERRERERREREAKLEKERLDKERKLKEEQEAKRKKERELAEQKKREAENKRLADQKRREEEKKRLAEEKRRKEEQARIAREKEEQLSKLLAQQEAEAAARSRLDAYSRLVADRIKRYIVLPPNIQGNPEAQFQVVQIPGGEILHVTLKRSSGNAAYDAAVERAIRKAQPLPAPPDPARFGEVRELDLKFRPKE